jgi:hypothetical protein
LLLELPDGGYAAVCIGEDRAGLVAADELVTGWSAAGHPAFAADLLHQIAGEVIARNGL